MCHVASCTHATPIKKKATGARKKKKGKEISSSRAVGLLHITRYVNYEYGVCPNQGPDERYLGTSPTGPTFSLSLPTLISKPRAAWTRSASSTHSKRQTRASVCPSRERSFSITSQNSNPRIASGHTGRRGCETGAPLDDPATARLDSGVQVTKKYSLLGSASVSITQSTGNAPWHAN